MIKTAHFRRAIWFSDFKGTLQGALHSCLKDVADGDPLPVFSLPDGDSCVIARRDISRTPVFLHLVKFEKGASAAVIQAAATAPFAEAEPANPPDGREFIHTQLFVAVRGNDLVWTLHNAAMREGPITSLLTNLVNEFHDDEEASQFELQAVLDSSIFRAAFESGIAEIDLGVGSFKQTLESLIGEGQPSFFNKSRSTEEIEAASNISGRFILKPGKSCKKPMVKELMKSMADSTVDTHSDGFTILTKNGIRLTKDKMTIKREYEVEGNRQMVDAIGVKSKLLETLTNLDSDGILES
ncbi:hypothetical protein [Minwuia thermotolerans]|uniref:hypothetical protein n=1 Tax=Minwuia thermotolerans TaxID=2056226 RepID=UPI000F62D29F|nr:hypothetical protein [Minwuia thermotolerans]